MSSQVPLVIDNREQWVKLEIGCHLGNITLLSRRQDHANKISLSNIENYCEKSSPRSNMSRKKFVGWNAVCCCKVYNKGQDQKCYLIE